MVNTHTVLVIDDSITFCEFIAQALEKVGYRVIAAADGHKGLIKVLQEHPVCVILDVILPGLSGFEVCRQLRARDPQHSLPIIMISSKNTPLNQMWGLRQGANRYLPKPFTQEVLVQTVTEVMPPALRPRPTLPLKTVSTNYSDTDEQQTLQSLYKLIPHRRGDAVFVIALTAIASFIGDNITGFPINVGWFKYTAQTVCFLFIVLSLARSSDEYLCCLIIWQVVACVLLMVLLTPIMPAEIPVTIKIVLGGSCSLICVLTFFFYVSAL